MSLTATPTPYTSHLNSPARAVGFALIIAIACGCGTEDQQLTSVGSAQHEISSGSSLASYQDLNYYRAVTKFFGTSGCSATVITHEAVLTAAHCVCPSQTSTDGCLTRGTVVLENVRPADDPSTPLIDESLSGPTSIQIDGDVVVHDDYGASYALAKDYAVVLLDEPVYEVATNVVPMAIANDNRKPDTNDIRTVAGYGATGTACLQPADPGGRVGFAHIYEVVDDAIRVDDTAAYPCMGDSGGPIFDLDQFVLGPFSKWAGTVRFYRPVYEVFDWVNSHTDPLETPSDRSNFDVSRGRSWNLGDDYDVYNNYRPEVGIVGNAVSPGDGYVYTWYVNGTYSVGRSWDLREQVQQKRYSTAPGQWPSNIVGMGISSSNLVYTWYDDGTVSKGTFADLDSSSGPYGYSLPSGKTPSDLVALDISSSDVVYAWYGDGTRSWGRSWDLDALGVGTYSTAYAKTFSDIAEIAIAPIAPGDDRVFTWYRYDPE